MKNLKAYKIVFNRPQDPDDDVVQDIVVGDIFKEKVTSYEFFEGFEKEEELTKTLYFFLPDINVDNFLSFIEEIKKVEKGWLKEYKEITEDILFNNKYLDEDNEDELISEYFKSNLSTDDVLDKINSIGFDNLSDLDKEILSTK